jgi:hypothetical protein
VIVGAVLTALGGLLARALDEQRRYLRYLRLALGAEPEGVLIDRGQGRALAFALEAARVSVLWDRGRKGLVYRLEQLMGAELIADHVVLARVYRDEPGKRLDEIPRSADQIVLRLIFDNPRDPEFELELWPARRGSGHAYPAPAEAAQAGRRLGRKRRNKASIDQASVGSADRWFGRAIVRASPRKAMPLDSRQTGQSGVSIRPQQALSWRPRIRKAPI